MAGCHKVFCEPHAARMLCRPGPFDCYHMLLIERLTMIESRLNVNKFDDTNVLQLPNIKFLSSSYLKFSVENVKLNGVNS